MMKHFKIEGNAFALLPFFVFIFTFLGAGIFLNDFYALPSPVAVVLGIIVAFLIYKNSTDSKVATLIEGCGNSQIITMCLIYLFSGAFATVTQAMGAVDSVVNLGINNIDAEYFPLGIFLIASFLSTSIGSSVGSIVALGPIAISLADKTGASMPLIAGSLLGGSMLGDNLSIISDTTIAATQSLGCKMRDKFKVNLFIALPASIVTVLILFYLGMNAEVSSVAIEKGNYELVTILPYLLVIILAVSGVNVFTTLIIGILAAGIIGFIGNKFSLLQFTQKIYEGFLSMTDIFLLSMLTGGLAALVQKAGGIDYVLHKIKSKIKSKKSAQMGIGTLVSLTNIAIANNTVSIVITGKIAKEISDKYDLSTRKVATILDVFSCIVQGILPYGAQVLLIVGFAKGKIDFLDLISNAWYIYILLLFMIMAIYSTAWDKRINKFIKD